MSQFFVIHPENPQQRLINQAISLIHEGGVVVYPTDSSYAIGCHLDYKEPMERIRHLRKMDKEHNFTLVCRDLSEVSNYAKVDNVAFRLMKSLSPGPYTFILKATHEVPRRLQHPKRKTIGLRMPDHAIVQSLLTALGEPMMSATLTLPNSDTPETNAEEIMEKIGKQVDLIIDGGYSGIEPTTVLDLINTPPTVIRQGKGTIDGLTDLD